MKVFVSYASEQKDTAERLIAHLSNDSHQVLAGPHLFEAGAEYDERIRQAIDQAELFIFLISPQSVTQGRYTLTELKYAQHKWRNPGWHVLPVVASRVLAGDVPPFLSPISWLEPQGNLYAEVGARVGELNRTQTRRRSKMLGAAAASIVAIGATVLIASSAVSHEGSRARSTLDAASVSPAKESKRRQGLPDGPLDAADDRHESTNGSNSESVRDTRAASSPHRWQGALEEDPRCQAKLSRQSDGWWLTCQCRGALVARHPDVFLGPAEAAPRPADVLAEARLQKWRCP